MMWHTDDIICGDDITTSARTTTTRPTTNPCPKPLTTCLKASVVGVCTKASSKPKHHKKVHFED